MLVTCWSVKGGVGTTTVAAGLAISAAASAAGCLLVDLEGDLPKALGVPDPAGPGVAGWSRAGGDVPPDALARIEHRLSPGLHLLPRGRGGLEPSRMAILAELLALDHRIVVVDAGRLDHEPDRAPLATGAARSVLVTRACYLALARGSNAPVAPTEVIVVRDPGRALRPTDIDAITGAPTVAELRVDPAVARALDAGLLSARLPRSFAGALRAVMADEAWGRAA
ncbi:MAG: cellulose synthase operon protein YhjQ/BcsQ [Acidimicrobiales bacterium]